MAIYIYSKVTDDIKIFDEVIEFLKKETDKIFVTIEHKRSFRELNNLKINMQGDDVLLISRLDSLGVNEAEQAGELEFFVKNKKYLVISNIKSTYEYGISQPMNQAVLKTILDSLLSNNNLIKLGSNRKANAGRNKIEFPDNWEELFEKWEKNQISSKQFIKESGLKKATFYNMVTEYKELLKINEIFVNKYKLG